MPKILFPKKITQILIFALIYYVTGKLGLKISLPPGYASLVWAPFGLSTMFLLLFGTNRFPGVFLGALLANSSLTFSAYWYVAFEIAAGNTLATLLAVYLVKRFIQYPKSVYYQKEILLFLIIVGPVAAFLNSVVGVSSLYLNGKLQSSPILLNWLYWWIGDSIGAFVFSPLALIFTGEHKFDWKKSITTLFIPLGAFIIVIIGALVFFNGIQTEKEIIDFKNQSKTSFAFIERISKTVQDRLSALLIFYDNSKNISDDEFENYASFLMHQQPQIIAMLWIPLNGSKVTRFKNILYVPHEIQGQLGNLSEFLKINHEEHFKKPHKESQQFAFGPFNLENINQNQPCFLLSAYSKKHHGFVASIISIARMESYIPESLRDPSLRIRFLKDPQHNGNSVLYDNLATYPNSIAQFNQTENLLWQDSIQFGDQKWVIQYARDASLHPQSVSSNNIFLIMALIFSYITCALVTITYTRFITVEDLAEEKTILLKDLNLQLEKASETKSAFISSMSHEIRTPLNVLIGITDLLDDPCLSHENKHYIEIAKKAGQSLLNIINDILDLSKIEAGLMTLERTEVNLENILKNTSDLFQVEVTRKKIKLQTEIDQNINRTYWGDSNRIQQILFNLVSNAVKFTVNGTILIKVSANSDPTMKGNILFEVSDTGIGISTEKMDLLFKPFSQTDTTITRKYGGTGLGLSICKKLTELMQGTIRAHSIENKGSNFKFSIELPPIQSGFISPTTKNEDNIIEESRPPKLIHKRKKDFKILIVDDMEDNRTLFKAYLKNISCDIYEAENGITAVEMTKSQRPDLILMDMQMPIMDGFTATQKIREWENSSGTSHSQIWALTAYALKDEMKRSFDSGCNKHLTKPLKRDDLIKNVKKLMDFQNIELFHNTDEKK